MKRALLLILALIIPTFGLPALTLGMMSVEAEAAIQVPVPAEQTAAMTRLYSAPLAPTLASTAEPGSATTDPLGITAADDLPEPSAELIEAPPDELPEESIMPSDSEITVRLLTKSGIISVSLDYYLARVVSAEMPPSFPDEALKAQAVAARTLLYNRKAASESGRGKHSNADVCTSAACCTAYVAPFDAATRAVADTDGVIMTVEDMPILAAFHSSSGGKTRSSGDVWGGALAYLTPVDSPDAAYGRRGHGVGMSQYGAKEMAGGGSTYTEILTHYYTGVALTVPAAVS